MHTTSPFLPPAAVLLVGTGCAKKPVPPPPAFSSQAWFAHSAEPLRYTDHSGTGTNLQAEEHATERVEERCVATDPPPGSPAHALSAVTACHTDRSDGTRLTTLYGTHPLGEIYFGQRKDDHEWHFHSPKIAVPKAFDMGSTWSARHADPTHGDQLRRCVVEPTPWCVDGAAVTCTTFQVHQVTLVRNHWCPAFGHTGHEAVVVRPGRAPFWSWSSSPQRGEVLLPDRPIEQRPLPELEPIMGIAHALTPERLAELSPDHARISESP